MSTGKPWIYSANELTDALGRWLARHPTREDRARVNEALGMSRSVLHTDKAAHYRQIGQEFSAHEAVDHEAGEYVRGDVTTNHAEGFFSQLKRSLDGTHHKISREHLDRYLAEFDYRYSTRTMKDSMRVDDLMTRVAGRRLAYRPLTTASAS